MNVNNLLGYYKHGLIDVNVVDGGDFIKYNLMTLSKFNPLLQGDLSGHLPSRISTETVNVCFVAEYHYLAVLAGYLSSLLDPVLHASEAFPIRDIVDYDRPFGIPIVTGCHSMVSFFS